MLYREIITVCAVRHTKHRNTLYQQNAELLSVKPGGNYSNHFKGLLKYGGIYTCPHELNMSCDGSIHFFLQ